MKIYRKQLAQWQARQPVGGRAQAGGPGGDPSAGGSGQLGQFSLPNITQYSAGLASNLIDQANGQSPYLQQQIGNLGQNIGQFFNQQIMPGIANDAGGYGQYGGSRQGIAQGMGAQQALQSFQQGATDLYANNWNNGATRANSLYGLGMQPYTAQFQPLMAMGQLLGSPTVLGGGGGGGTSWSQAGSFGMGPNPSSGGQLPSCHIARLVFGPENPEWVLFYRWKEARPAIKAVYDRVCIPVAAWLADKPRLQGMVRRWMRWAIKG